MPILTIVGALLPLIGAGVGNMLGQGSRGSGGWGLGEIAIFVFLILAGAVLGVVSTVLAFVRGERWRPVQAIVLLANLWVALFLGSAFLRGRRVEPPIPVGETAFLALAPGPERMGAERIFLAYPAPDPPDPARGYFVGQRDARGIVSSVRSANGFEPLEPGEVRIQLVPVNGRWTVFRRDDHISKLSERKWKNGTYLEIRVTQQGWGIPIGIVDRDLHPVN